MPPTPAGSFQADPSVHEQDPPGGYWEPVGIHTELPGGWGEGGVGWGEIASLIYFFWLGVTILVSWPRDLLLLKGTVVTHLLVQKSDEHFGEGCTSQKNKMQLAVSRAPPLTPTP